VTSTSNNKLGLDCDLKAYLSGWICRRTGQVYMQSGV
jgi:hypothetical protein